MGAKYADSQVRGRPRRRHEIAGIFFLAFGLFAGLSLASLHAGDNRLMGPGGAAAAAGLYALAGVCAYLVIAGLLVGAWRSFRGRPLVDGFAEGAGAVFTLTSLAVLLHLVFSGGRQQLHGPGGLLGEWVGELTAGFIGSFGAGLAAAALLFAGVLLLTEIELREVTAAIGWAARHLREATWAGMSALGKLVVAMFPRRTDDERSARSGRDARGEDDRYGDGDDRHDDDEDAGEDDGRLVWNDGRGDALPMLREREDSEGIRIGRAKALAARAEEQNGRGDERRASIAAVVAEVAAVDRGSTRPTPANDAFERAASGTPTILGLGTEADEDAEPDVIDEAPAAAVGQDRAGAAAAAPGPIIVEPAWRTRMRERERDQELKAQEQKNQDGKRGAGSGASSGGAANGTEGPGFIKLKDADYELPATQLLDYLPPQGNDMDKQALYDMAERLEQAMANYGVRGKVKEIHMGPVVTMYEFAPAPGTRTGKIANLEKDLAMALEAQAVRIVAPIPGKAVVGVEVPNRTREMVYLREILEDDCFARANSKLQVALGKDIKGAPVSVNLAKMPHLLVAGTTGSGKSVAVNGMIVSLLYNASPEDVRFIMVDPKMLELSIYEGIPHLLLPVVTDPKKANLALRWAVEEMERRYELLAKAGVRDIAGYNATIDAQTGGTPEGAGKGQASLSLVPDAAAKKKLKVMLAGPDGVEREVELDGDTAPDASTALAAGGDAADTLVTSMDGVVQVEMDPDEVSAQAAAAQAAREDASGPAAAPPKKLPYIVIVIDEFADLMMVAPKDVETSVARIAQKARAAGLHLILATQRPSVDVITGLIKANFPSRIALQVASKIDSRTILDQPGADTLLGNGDMLFSDRGMKLRRVHGAFLSDGEVHRVVEHLKGQAKPVYDMDILKPRDEDAEEGGAPADDFHDDLYDQAIAIVCETRQASVSYIQRRLQIGYNRAARMVEQMERDGIVGPANGAKPREVLAPPGEYLQQAG